MTTRYFQLASGTFAVWDSMMSGQAPKVGSTLITEYDETLYPVIHAQLNANTKTAIWNPILRTLTIDSVVVLDGAWIDAEANRLATLASNKTEDTSERAQLLSLAASALTQIANDRTAIATGKTALAAAATLAQVKPIVDGMLDRLDNICQRQERIVKALRAVIRSGLNGT